MIEQSTPAREYLDFEQLPYERQRAFCSRLAAYIRIDGGWLKLDDDDNCSRVRLSDVNGWWHNKEDSKVCFNVVGDADYFAWNVPAGLCAEAPCEPERLCAFASAMLVAYLDDLLLTQS